MCQKNLDTFIAVTTRSPSTDHGMSRRVTVTPELREPRSLLLATLGDISAWTLLRSPGLLCSMKSGVEPAPIVNSGSIPGVNALPDGLRNST